MALRSDLDAASIGNRHSVDRPDRRRERFLRAFEDWSELILGLAEGSEQEYVLDCLFIMLRKSGVCDGFNGFTLH